MSSFHKDKNISRIIEGLSYHATEHDKDMFGGGVESLNLPPSPVYQQIHKQSILSRPSSVGALDILPLETQHEVCQHLDIDSLGMLRLTSYAGREIVDSVDSYVHIRADAELFLRTLESKDLCHVNTLGELSQALSSRSCDACGTFAHYFFPLTGSRCCFFCLATNMEFAFIRKLEAWQWFGPASTKGLPSIFIKERSLSGPGGWKDRVEVIEYFSAKEVMEICREKYGRSQYYEPPNTPSGETREQQFWVPDERRRCITYAATVQIPLVSKEPGQPNRSVYSGGYYCSGCTRWPDDDSRGLWFGSVSLSFTAYSYEEGSETTRRWVSTPFGKMIGPSVYTVGELLEHLTTCERVAEDQKKCPAWLKNGAENDIKHILSTSVNLDFVENITFI
ncbi:hypothetical protein SBOR_3336 [Sclerotinia borealis F-4128]|uniref:F-box domain-containing protein n=1 Tax=Sclerotinia borealis (strain F-4128) TaxID=1432307 RepID=W9CKA4_SCLBF|nr:hypothetical protein SBOR_3336 [Sclerotinia borealis F-4128]